MMTLPAPILCCLRIDEIRAFVDSFCAAVVFSSVVDVLLPARESSMPIPFELNQSIPVAPLALPETAPQPSLSS